MFEGKGLPLSENGLDGAKRLLGIDLATLWAVLTVETKGCGFLPTRQPVILFERHIFHRLTNGRFDAEAPDLSNVRPGGYGSTETQYERLGRAIRLDREPALKSASWGLGQIMGFNASIAGFRNVETMVEAMCRSEDAQLKGVAAYIDSTGLTKPLKRQDWAAFARGYNGEDFKKNRYDEKLALAHARYAAGTVPNLGVRSAQLYLMYLGYAPGDVDGWFGAMTQTALLRFQADQGLPRSGKLDAKTQSTLERAARAKAPK
ncbi:MAG: N-acetylmuramidase domain-containing protein [Nitrospira sp.]|nr:N-acetylmuramidase domain-containing protein [Nitrospira sp.]